LDTQFYHHNQELIRSFIISSKVIGERVTQISKQSCYNLLTAIDYTAG